MRTKTARLNKALNTINSVLGATPAKVSAGAIDLSKLVETAASSGRPLVMTSDEAEDLVVTLDDHPNFGKLVKTSAFRTLKAAVLSGNDAELSHRDVLELLPFMSKSSASGSAVAAAGSPKVTPKQYAGYKKAQGEGISANDGYNKQTFGITQAIYSVISKCLNDIAGSDSPRNVSLADLNKFLAGEKIQLARIHPDLQKKAEQVLSGSVSAAVALVDTIGPGDRVTIMTPQGQQATGKAVMRGPYGWVLNMGGAHGRPGIASDDNVIKVVKGKGVRNPLSGASKASTTSAAIAPRDVSKFEDQSAIEGVIMSILNGPTNGEVPVSVDTSQLWAQTKAKAKAWRLGPVNQSAFAKALKGLVKSRQAILGEANEAGYRTVTLAPTTGYKVFSQFDNKYELLGEVPGPDLGRALKQAAKLVLDPNWTGGGPKFSKWQGKIGVIRFDDSPEVVEVYPSNLAYIPQMKKANFRTAYEMTAAADRKVKAASYAMLPNVREVNRVIRRGVLPQTTLVNAVAEVLTRRHMSARLVEAITAALTEAFEEGAATDVLDMPQAA